MNAEESTAGLGRRLGARVVDWLLTAAISVVGMVILLAVDGAAGVSIGLALHLAAFAFGIWNQVVRVGRTGHSLGKQWLSLRVADERTDQPIGIGRALARELVLGLLAAVCLVPALVNLVIIARDPRRQGWHDKAAASVVVPLGARPVVPVSPVTPASDAPPAAPPSPATGATPPPPYSPAAPPPAPGFATPPPPVDHEAGAETVSRPPGAPVPPPAPSSGMVGPPPGVVPPPPGESPTVEPASPEAPDELPAEETIMGPARGAAPAGGPATGEPAWRISAPDGSSRVVDGPVLVGRDPDPELVGGAAVWAIDDPQLTMSKTHALLGIDDGVAWVEDWHSTNGVALHRGEAALVIEPHARTPLRDGDVIELGAYRVTVEART